MIAVCWCRPPSVAALVASVLSTDTAAEEKPVHLCYLLKPSPLATMFDDCTIAGDPHFGYDDVSALTLGRGDELCSVGSTTGGGCLAISVWIGSYHDYNSGAVLLELIKNHQ